MCRTMCILCVCVLLRMCSHAKSGMQSDGSKYLSALANTAGACIRSRRRKAPNPATQLAERLMQFRSVSSRVDLTRTTTRTRSGPVRSGPLQQQQQQQRTVIWCVGMLHIACNPGADTTLMARRRSVGSGLGRAIGTDGLGSG